MKGMICKVKGKSVRGCKKQRSGNNNLGMTTVEIILIVVVIFTIYMGCK